MQNLDTKTNYESKFYTGEEIENLITEKMSNVDTEQAKIIDDLKNKIEEQRRERARAELEKMELDEGFLEMMDLRTDESYIASLEILQKHAGTKAKKKLDATKSAIRKMMGLKN